MSDTKDVQQENDLESMDDEMIAQFGNISISNNAGQENKGASLEGSLHDILANISTSKHGAKEMKVQKMLRGRKLLRLLSKAEMLLQKSKEALKDLALSHDENNKKIEQLEKLERGAKDPRCMNDDNHRMLKHVLDRILKLSQQQVMTQKNEMMHGCPTNVIKEGICGSMSASNQAMKPAELLRSTMTLKERLVQFHNMIKVKELKKFRLGNNLIDSKMNKNEMLNKKMNKRERINNIRNTMGSRLLVTNAEKGAFSPLLLLPPKVVTQQVTIPARNDLPHYVCDEQHRSVPLIVNGIKRSVAKPLVAQADSEGPNMRQDEECAERPAPMQLSSHTISSNTQPQDNFAPFLCVANVVNVVRCRSIVKPDKARAERERQTIRRAEEMAKRRAPQGLSSHSNSCNIQPNALSVPILCLPNVLDAIQCGSVVGPLKTQTENEIQSMWQDEELAKRRFPLQFFGKPISSYTRPQNLSVPSSFENIVQCRSTVKPFKAQAENEGQSMSQAKEFAKRCFPMQLFSDEEVALKREMNEDSSKLIKLVEDMDH